MTSWIGNSLLGLKDQITNLTREALADADEDAEQPKFVQIEKFNRLVRICEEKEDQICLMQQEIDRLRNYAEASSSEQQGADSSKDLCNADTEDNRAPYERNVLFGQGNESEVNKNAQEELIVLQSKEDSPLSSTSSQNDESNSDEKQVQNVLLRIENLCGKNRLEQLHTILKEVKSAFEAEKAKIKPSASIISFPSSKNSHGTDETMSNDSERSDDSLLHDFEILKPRSTSGKSLEELSLSNAEVQTSSQMTRSTSTQSEFEFSPVGKINMLSASGSTGETADRKIATTEFDEMERSLEINLHCWEQVFTKMNSMLKNENTKSCENYSNQDESFWSELNELIFKNNESLKNYVVTLAQENKSWKKFYESLNQNEECSKQRIEKLIERESSLSQSIKQKNSVVLKYVNELNSYSKELEHFNASLNRVSDEIMDKTAELNGLYDALRHLNETKDSLSKENEELSMMIQTLRECKQDDLTEKQIEHESKFSLLKQHYEVLEKECTEQQQTLYSLEKELCESRNLIHSLDKELQKTREQIANQEHEHKTQIDSLKEKLQEVEIEKSNSFDDVQKEIVVKNESIAELRQQNQRLSNEIELLSSKFAHEVDSLTCKMNALDEQKKEMGRNVTTVVQSNVENEDAAARFREIIALLENYFAPSSSSDEERKVWQRIAEFVVELRPRKNENGDGEDKSTVPEEITLTLKQHEIENKNLRERVAQLECDLKQQLDYCAVLQNNVLDLEGRLSTFASEREQVIISLKEKHSESLSYHNELQKVHALFVVEQEKNKEYNQQIQDLKHKLANNSNVVAELERLRSHLLTMEESYTSELVNSEDQIKELRSKLMEYEDHVKSISAAQTSVNVRTNQITESLQKEIKTLTEEKDNLASNLKSCQTELQKSIQDAQNLRSALDLFYRNKDSEIFQATEKLQTDIKLLQNENRVLQETAHSLQSNLDAMKEKSNEKNLLYDEIKYKEEVIRRLEVQVKEVQVKLVEAETKISELTADTENKFKLNLLKNIMLRYIVSNTENMRIQALQILAEVLDFSIDEKRKVGLSVLDSNKQKSESSTPKDSLLDEFIRFVEKESDPKGSIIPQEKKNTPNILLSPSSSLPDVMLPTLSSFPVNHNSRYILKDVLQ